MKYLFGLALAMACAAPAHAGFYGLTIHSRANCYNNESITWDWTKNHRLWTQSVHYKLRTYQHSVTTGWQTTWRSAAVHWGEGGMMVPGPIGLPVMVPLWPPVWQVIGYHWRVDPLTKRSVRIGVTSVSDCSFYNGWWG